MLPSLAGFLEKNRNDLSSMLPGSSLTLSISESQINGLLKNKQGVSTKLKKTIIKFK